MKKNITKMSQIKNEENTIIEGKMDESKIDFENILTDDDKLKFDKQYNLIGIRVETKYIKHLKILKPYSFQKKGIKPYQNDINNDNYYKIILLNENIKSKDLNGIPNDIIDKINSIDNIEIINYSLKVRYQQLTVKEILKEILPNNVDIPMSYETVGHIIHFNLKKSVLKWKYIIGQIYLDKLKNNGIKTIINKTNKISNQFRVFPYEIIAGNHDMITTVKENGNKFMFDFSKVYWNSKLGTEHIRLINNNFNKYDIIFDITSGVGPFTIPCIKNKKCIVHANDLNPDSYYYLNKNIKLNKISNGIKTTNLDMKVFWKNCCKNKQKIIKDNKKMYQNMVDNEHKQTNNEQNHHKLNMDNKFVDHIIMNLPDSGLEYLGIFKECYSENEINKYGLPKIYCYCFALNNEYIKSINDRVIQYLGILPDKIKDKYNIRFIRDVGPLKHMYCVSFKLPHKIALNTNNNKMDLNGIHAGSKRSIDIMESNKNLKTNKNDNILVKKPKLTQK